MFASGRETPRSEAAIRRSLPLRFVYPFASQPTLRLESTAAPSYASSEGLAHFTSPKVRSSLAQPHVKGAAASASQMRPQSILKVDSQYRGYFRGEAT